MPTNTFLVNAFQALRYTKKKKRAISKLLKEAPALVILNEDYCAFSPPLQFIWLLFEIHPSCLQGKLLKEKVTFKDFKRPAWIQKAFS